MDDVRISTEYIKLSQFLKWADVVNSGSEAKFLIGEELVKVNGEIETRKGKKLVDGDIVSVNDHSYKIKKEN